MWIVVFTHGTKNDLRSIRMNRYQFVTNNESTKNTNVKSEINKLNTNNRCQFLDNILPMKETSEHNPNRYCNVDFVFALGLNTCFLYFGIMVLFSIMNLYLFLKCIPSLLKFLSSLCFDMRSFCYLLCNNIDSYGSSVIVNASNKELQVCVWYKFIRYW